MTTLFPAGETVALVTRKVTGVDGDGNDITSDTTTTLPRIPVWPRPSTELAQGQDTVIVGLWCLLPPNTDVAAIDAVRVYGREYEVDGEPGRYTSPFTGFSSGVQVALTRVTG